VRLVLCAWASNPRAPPHHADFLASHSMAFADGLRSAFVDQAIIAWVRSPG